MQSPESRRPLNGKAIATCAMVFLVAASNGLVQFPLNDWLTWGAFSYPFTFMVTELTNRFYGPQTARQVVYRGFAVAVPLSFALADARIAMASCAAFLFGQLLDISVFTRLRRSSWWVAPAGASISASLLDTLVFFFLAFAGTPMNWATHATGDFSVKLTMDLLLLIPFRVLLQRFRPAPASGSVSLAYE